MIEQATHVYRDLRTSPGDSPRLSRLELMSCISA
jgi:hypothetical protein